MRYHPDDFYRLMEAVEEAGGMQIERRCEPTKIRLKAPNARGEMKPKTFFTAGCQQNALFAVPYEVPQGRLGTKMQKAGAGVAIVCAVDDDMGRWPRFAHVIEEDSG